MRIFPEAAASPKHYQWFRLINHEFVKLQKFSSTTFILIMDMIHPNGDVTIYLHKIGTARHTAPSSAVRVVSKHSATGFPIIIL
jgi:hypothetical protein